MALQRLRNDPEAGWELRNRTPLWGPDFLMVSPDCTCGDAPYLEVPLPLVPPAPFLQCPCPLVPPFLVPPTLVSLPRGAPYLVKQFHNVVVAETTDT